MTRGRLAAVAAAVALLCAGCSESAPAGPVATSHVDLPPSYRFEPQAIEVPAGEAVTWTNSDNFTHSVRLPDDGNVVLNMAPGESASFTFDEPGLHAYDCSFHATEMKGTVLVTEEG